MADDEAAAIMTSKVNEILRAMGRLRIADDDEPVDVSPPRREHITPFETTFFGFYEPVLQALLAQLPTRTLFNLYQTSPHIKKYLAHYPLAWRTLSFRLPQPPPVLGPQGLETPDGRERNARQLLLNGFLIHIVVPISTRLTVLDLCNTAVDGVALCSNVWGPRRGTLKHLSVRGCKNVSIKYHIVPFLRNSNPKDNPWLRRSDLAIKSLYTYRCRHHRRRPYLPASLIRRDSDSEPTHDLIELCYAMGIWTDTAWCPTPGPRCYRRKDYHGNRAAPGTAEVWVPYDRLWRSQNRLGPVDTRRSTQPHDGRLWEVAEHGSDGEVIRGVNEAASEGKDMPAHTRSSHRIFVEDVKCDQCGDAILERCETCSVRMHCMGCRKTLCASCAFNRPVPPNKRQKIRNFSTLLQDAIQNTPSPNTPALSTARKNELRRKNQFWWAPGAHRSPNLMNELSDDDSDSETDDGESTTSAAANQPLKLNMHWCCLEPIFSGGGGIAFLGPGLGGRGAEKVRAAPLPRRKRYADPDFILSPAFLDNDRAPASTFVDCGEDLDVVPFLKQDNCELQAQTCPRSLCQDCYRMPRWRVKCRGCTRPLCKEHDFRGLKFRKCGYRDLAIEREFIRSQSPPKGLVIPPFRAPRFRPRTLDVESQTEESEAGDDAPLMSRQDSASTTTTILGYPSATPSVNKALFDTDTRYVSSNTSTSFMSSLPRHRSHSFSGVRPRTTIAEHLSTMVQTALSPMGRVPLPGRPNHPVQWIGCGEYFCQAFRPIGDTRPRCVQNMKQCGDCGVWVCSMCLTNNEPCKCSYCFSNYTCPLCATHVSNREKCRQLAESNARAVAELARQELEAAHLEYVKQAEEVAGYVNDFFEGLELGDTAVIEAQASLQQQALLAIIEEVVSSVDVVEALDGSLTTASTPLPSSSMPSA